MCFCSVRVLKSLAEDTKKQQTQTKKQEPYKDISASFKIPGMKWDIKQWIVDLAHEIGNLIKNMLQLTTNKKKTSLHWKKALRDFERKHGRFKDIGTNAPWHHSKEVLADLIWLCTKLRVILISHYIYRFCFDFNPTFCLLCVRFTFYSYVLSGMQGLVAYNGNV